MKITSKVSSQPRKQRKAVYNAPLHVRQKLVSSHLSKELRKSLKKRSLPVRKGDKVVVLMGKYKKREGVVARVDLGSLKVYVEGLAAKKQSGRERPAPIESSNLVIIQAVDRKAKITPASKAKAEVKKAEPVKAQVKG